MKRILSLVIMTAFLTASAFAQDEPAKDGALAGVYHCIGSENDKTYYSVMTVEHREGSDIIATVHVTGGGVVHGIGVIKGDTIALSWKQTVPSGAVGVTHFTLSKDKKTWDGIWAAPGAETPRKERATFLKRIRGLEL